MPIFPLFFAKTRLTRQFDMVQVLTVTRKCLSILMFLAPLAEVTP